MDVRSTDSPYLVSLSVVADQMWPLFGCGLGLGQFVTSTTLRKDEQLDSNPAADIRVGCHAAASAV